MTEQKLEGKISAPQVKRKWENLKQKYKVRFKKKNISSPQNFNSFMI